MDQAQQWTWAKRKHGLIIGNTTNYKASNNNDDSWEEQAFAEDSSGPLGGCIWPPRSYSCSFCRREFRSAQALGGHMNVHRRDRARLKQSPPDLHEHNNNNPLMINSLGSSSSSTIPQIPKFPSQVCNPNPNLERLNPNHHNLIITPPPPTTTTTTQQQPCHSSFLLIEENNHKNSDMKWSNNPSCWSNLATTSNTSIFPYSSCHKDVGGLCRTKRDYHIKTSDLSVSLNLVVCRSCPTTTLSGSCNKLEDDHRQALVSPCKRRKTTTSTDDDDEDPCSVGSIHHYDDQVSPCSIHELDLELRLGIGLHK